MSDPLTINFGPWSPDLQNIPYDVLSTPLPLTVPTADCLNVYYQDGRYQCLPGLNAFAPTLGAQALQAFNWYDNTEGQELLFAATANGISELVDGAWSPVGVENVIVVQPASWASLRTGWQGLNTVAPLKAKTTWNNAGINVVGGTIFNGTLTAGNVGGGGGLTGYKASSFGTLSPLKDSLGNAIGALYNEFLPMPGTNRTIFQVSATVPQTYFTQLSVPTIALNLLSSSVLSFASSGGTSTWIWSSALGVANGASYNVVIHR